MKSALKTIGLVILVIVVFFGAWWVVAGNSFFIYKWLAPQIQATQREVFEESKSYNQGMAQNLQKMQFEYIREKDPDAKAALASVILHEYAAYDTEKLPDDQREFLNSLKPHTFN